MSLISTLNIGRTALASQQAAIQVTGNNIANSGNADYTRQTANLSPGRDYVNGQGLAIGSGVNLSSITRNIDEALQNRLRNSLSDASSSDVSQQWLSRLETVFNELGNQDLSTKLGQFFNGWSDLANSPQDAGKRQIVIQNGQSLANWVKDIKSQMSGLKSDIDQRLKNQVTSADKLASQIAQLNDQIGRAEGGGGGGANGLRDQRDAIIKQLSQLVDVRAVEDGSMTNIYIGSDPLVLGTSSRGLSLRQDSSPQGDLTYTVTVTSTGAPVELSSGELAALGQTQQSIKAYSDELDRIASGLIFEVNKLHTAGQGLAGFASVTSTAQVLDTTAALNSDDAGLDFQANNGSFVVHVKDKVTGSVTSTLVQVDLDGLNADDTTLDSLRASLDGITNVGATVTGGRLTVNADSSAVEISFSQDSSGMLAALGINTFFKGSSASDIAVNDTIVRNANYLAAAKNGQPADNQTALAIAALATQKLSMFNNSSIADTYTDMVNRIGLAASDAKTSAEASNTVMQTLEAQRQSLSGVSLDEEAVNLIKQQRAFQGASRLISAVDEMMQTILAMV